MKTTKPSIPQWNVETMKQTQHQIDVKSMSVLEEFICIEKKNGAIQNRKS